MFLNLTMLAGLGGALVPLILHLLSRSRYRTVEWGAMMFLQGADAKEMQSARFKQWVVLAMRMAMIALLAMALAQPVLRGRWANLSREGRITAVILMDCSASMSFDENGRSRMELARGAVLNILESLKDNRAGIILMGAREPELLATPTVDLQQLAQRVVSLAEPAGRADIASSLNRAIQILNASGDVGRELYIVTDRQASSWQDVSGNERSFVTKLDQPGTVTRFFVVPVGSDKSENLAIEALELVSPPAIAQQAAEIELRVRNFGKSYRSGVGVRVEDVGSPTTGQTASISVAPESTASIRLPWNFRNAGSHVIGASLAGGTVRFDDSIQTAIDVVNPIRVLIVSGDERAVALQSESDFLRIALAPRAAEARLRGDTIDKPRGDPCRVDVEIADRWEGDALEDYQVVILANVPQITPAQALALEQFVFEGGGLFIAPGNLTRAESYNAALYRGGAGFVPIRLLSSSAEEVTEPTTIQGVSDFEHPIFRFLKGRPDPIPLVTIGRYLRAEVRGRDAHVLAQYASGAPFLIESSAGRGRILLSTPALDADWSTLPLSNFYLPFVQSAVRYLAAGGILERNISPGTPILARFNGGPEIKPQIRTPVETWKDVPIVRGEVRYTNTRTPGLYELRTNLPAPLNRQHFVVQTPRVESDLSPLTEKRLRELSSAIGFEVIDPGEQSIRASVTSARGGRELWIVFVGGVLALAILELTVLRRWSAQEPAP
jgi:hypothetical protein